MGDHINSDVLDDFINGRLRKSTLEIREDYTDIIDFKRLHNDYIDNAITERSLVCLDKAFFRNNFQ